MTEWLVRRFVKDSGNTGDAAVRTAYGQFAGIVCIVCNIALCIAKGAIGAVAGSVSIVADAVNNLSDAASNIVSLLGFKLASRPADPEHPYGHGRYEYLAGLVVAAVVLAIGINLVGSSVERILDPEPVEFSGALVAVLALSIAVKLWMAAFNRTLGKRIGSETLQATAVDSRNDVISTVAVLASAVVSQATGIQLDGAAGAAVGAFIVWSGIGLVRDTVNPLLGQAPSPELVEHIRTKIDPGDHAELVGHGDRLLEPGGGDHVRDRGLHAGLVERLGGEGEHEHRDRDGHEGVRAGACEVGRHHEGEEGVERRHDAALARAVGHHAADGREQGVGDEPRGEHGAVQGARPGEVQEVQGQDELEDLHAQQRERLRDRDGREAGGEQGLNRAAARGFVRGRVVGARVVRGLAGGNLRARRRVLTLRTPHREGCFFRPSAVVSPIA